MLEIAKSGTKYPLLSKVSTLIKVVQNSYIMNYPAVWEIVRSLKLVDYLLIHMDSPCYNYY